VRQLAWRDSRARLIRDLAAYVVELLAVGTVYFVLAKVGLTLASLNPGASAIWPATGFALAALAGLNSAGRPDGATKALSVTASK